mmetsp:Transcript_21768/g.35953  ORF Transcript_21768/g.35953 Transcript_21768/m.35953 type:complete len:89 (+) Transcript_21768:154-420(+)
MTHVSFSTGYMCLDMYLYACLEHQMDSTIVVFTNECMNHCNESGVELFHKYMHTSHAGACVAGEVSPTVMHNYSNQRRYDLATLIMCR